MSDSDKEQDHERVNFVLAGVEPEAELIKFSPIKSEKIRTDIVASHIAEASNAKAIAVEKKSEHIKPVIAIVQVENYQVAFQRTSIVQCTYSMANQKNGSMITPGGIKYEQEEDELDLPLDMPKLVSDYKRGFPDYQDPVQRGHHIEAIHPETKMVMRVPMG